MPLLFLRLLLYLMNCHSGHISLAEQTILTACQRRQKVNSVLALLVFQRNNQINIVSSLRITTMHRTSLKIVVQPFWSVEQRKRTHTGIRTGMAKMLIWTKLKTLIMWGGGTVQRKMTATKSLKRPFCS